MVWAGSQANQGQYSALTTLKREQCAPNPCLKGWTGAALGSGLCREGPLTFSGRHSLSGNTSSPPPSHAKLIIGHSQPGAREEEAPVTVPKGQLCI